MKKFSNKIIICVVITLTVTVAGGFAYLGANGDKQNNDALGKSQENIIGEVRFIRLKGCPEDAYKEIGAEIVNPNYFMCRSYLTDGEFVYYHGLRVVYSPIIEIQPLTPSFIATSSPDIKDDKLMGATIIKGADTETFEIIYFDDTLPAAQQNHTFTYARDKDTLYWEGKKFDGVDPDTFAILGRGFVKDKTAVYFQWQKLEGSDPGTFEFLWSGFARDKNFVYRNNPRPEIFEGVDPATFEKIDDNYLKDKNAVYYRQEKIEGSDPATFYFLSMEGYIGKDPGARVYAADWNAVYYNGKAIAGADPETFEFLSNGWSKDKNAIYRYDGTRIYGIDPATIEILPYGYVKDKNGVYHNDGDNKIQGADPRTFEALANGYVKDRNFVWFASYGYEGEGALSLQKLNNADSTSFEVIERQYARDNKAVYCSGKIMDGFDWGNVVMLKNNYLRDKNLVFFGCDKVDGADAGSFEVLDYSYSKDKNSVYYLGKKIDGADVESFKNLTCSYSKDKNNVYKTVGKGSGMTILKFDNFDAGTFRVIANCNPSDKNGVYTNSGEKIESADPETFKFVGGSYSKDAYRAYWKTIPIDGVDVATFKFLSGEFAKDKNTTYYKGEVYDDELKEILRNTDDNIEFMISPTLPPDGIIHDLEAIVPAPTPIYPIGL